MPAILNPNEYRLRTLIEVARGNADENAARELFGQMGGLDPLFSELWTRARQLSATRTANLPAAPPLRLESVTAADFVELRLQPRSALVKQGENGPDIFYQQSINQTFAWRGLGKTNFNLSLGGAIAAGRPFLNWHVTRPCTVGYVEGELPQSQLQAWLKRLKIREPNFHVLTLDRQPGNYFHKLRDSVGQELLSEWVERLGIEVLFLDSIATLVEIPTNDEDTWMSYLAWRNKMRSKGLCINEVHHAGKAGLQRGHSRVEDNLDVQIKLERPKNYIASEGLVAKLSFLKTRGTSGLHDLEIRLVEEGWVYSVPEFSNKDVCHKRWADGDQIQDNKLAEELGISATLVSRWHRMWKQEHAEKEPKTPKGGDNDDPGY
jgi:hypothetical protein